MEAIRSALLTAIAVQGLLLVLALLTSISDSWKGVGVWRSPVEHILAPTMSFAGLGAVVQMSPLVVSTTTRSFALAIAIYALVPLGFKNPELTGSVNLAVGFVGDIPWVLGHLATTVLVMGGICAATWGLVVWKERQFTISTPTVAALVALWFVVTGSGA